MNQLKATLTIDGEIECVTGLRVGGSGSGYEIGGMDNPIIRDARTGFPYIPGSSLKGKMRSLLEWAEGKVRHDGKVYFAQKDPDDPVSRVFGAPAEADRNAGPTRLIVRDAHPDEKTRKMLLSLEEKQGLPKAEIKTEVNINRITSKPLSGPRTVERVPAGSVFNFSLVYFVFDVEGLTPDAEMIDHVFTALRLVESSALGGSGSRGYGQVRFVLSNIAVRTVDDYRSGAAPSPIAADPIPLADFDDARLAAIKERIR